MRKYRLRPLQDPNTRLRGAADGCVATRFAGIIGARLRDWSAVVAQKDKLVSSLRHVATGALSFARRPPPPVNGVVRLPGVPRCSPPRPLAELHRGRYADARRRSRRRPASELSRATEDAVAQELRGAGTPLASSSAGAAVKTLGKSKARPRHSGLPKKSASIGAVPRSPATTGRGKVVGGDQWRR